MLEPASDVFPGHIELMLLALADNLGRSGDILLLNDSLASHVLVLHILMLFLGHGDHIHGLEKLSLTPLGPGSTHITSPVHISDLA